MLQMRDDRAIAGLYLDLALECFNNAARAEQADAAEALKRMGRRYVAQAAILDPGLNPTASAGRFRRVTVGAMPER
jgi:hypothetical protein